MARAKRLCATTASAILAASARAEGPPKPEAPFAGVIDPDLPKPVAAPETRPTS